MVPTVLGEFRRISANFGSPRTISYQIIGHGRHALKNLDPGVGARFGRMSNSKQLFAIKIGAKEIAKIKSQTCGK